MVVAVNVLSVSFLVHSDKMERGKGGISFSFQHSNFEIVYDRGGSVYAPSKHYYLYALQFTFISVFSEAVGNVQTVHILSFM